jgi:hypothetical protein
MSNFCLLAYIPCIILIIWLLFELRKYINVTKKLKQTEKVYAKVQEQRSKKKAKKQFVETIPPPKQPDYPSDYSSDNYPPTEEDYDYRTPEPTSRRGTRRRRRQREYDDSEYDYDRDYEPRRSQKRTREYQTEDYTPRSSSEHYDEYRDMKARHRRKPTKGRDRDKPRKKRRDAPYHRRKYNDDDTAEIDWD